MPVKSKQKELLDYHVTAERGIWMFAPSALPIQMETSGLQSQTWPSADRKALGRTAQPSILGV